MTDEEMKKTGITPLASASKKLTYLAKTESRSEGWRMVDMIFR